MGTKTPRLDNRTSRDIYNQALELAKHYCPEWADKEWKRDYFNPEDPGLVMFKLFSKMSEHLIAQLNRIPDKHHIAFLDFMGIDLLPAKPARVPLTFYLAEGASGAVIPQGTMVSSSKDPEVVFEVAKDMRVVSAKLGAVFTLNPAEDIYTDHSNPKMKTDRFSVFGDGEKRRIDHVLFLGDDAVFDIRRPVKELKIMFKGEKLSGEYFDWWLDDKIPHESIIVSPGADQLEVPFKEIPAVTRSKVDNIDSFWLSVRPADGMKIVDAEPLPVVSDINVFLTVGDILPEHVVFNDAPVDVKKGFYPFGENPKIGDTLYISSEEAFSKNGATITLSIKLKENITTSATLDWEFWNGKQWQDLTISSDTTNKFTVSAENKAITFTCPLIESAHISGLKSRWIRVRISSGDYGKSGTFDVKPLSDITKIVPDISQATIDKLNSAKITFGVYEKSTLTSPFIESIIIQYNYPYRAVQRIKTCNNFQYKNVKDTKFKPFEPFPDKKPALYLGFENDKKIAGTSISGYFAVKEKLFSAQTGITARNPGDLGFEWQYFSWTKYDWDVFTVEDETDSFIKGGIVFIQVPADAAGRIEFEKNLCWIRIIPKNKKLLAFPELKGISLNTVWAVNSITAKDEILGSGTGRPDLSVLFSRKPVLEDQIIEIKEPGIPPDAEVKTLESEVGTNPLRFVKDEKTGEIKEVWLRWHEVRDFARSNALSRHYVIDRANGIVLFGDGTRGMLPPNGKNNIVAREYRSGGGSKGNQEPGTITLLKRKLSNIESVTNHVSSSGGKDPENLEKAILRGPHTLKNRDRAVTKEDFEWLAREVSQDVVKARCITDGGKIYVIIVPSGDDDAPLPESGLIDAVEQELRRKALVTLRKSDRIQVTGPNYESIDVTVTVKLYPDADSAGVKESIINELRKFLHPLKGGQKGEGWDFGDGIFISEVAAVVERIKSIDYTIEIKLETPDQAAKGKVTDGGYMGYIALEKNTLPCAGSINVNTE